jgi:radical SAM superfamily enzyme YgiQ (UPF0313 family)
MSRLDALFLHVPRFERERREIMVMPTGLPALANLLADEGYSVEILHLGIESEVANGFSLRRYLVEHRPRLVLLSLHWSRQTKPVVDVAERVKRWLPDARVVLGGLTASVFAVEAVSSFPFVDCVVRGDGEAPLLALARAVIDGEGALEDVPNLVWRGGREDVVRESTTRWVLDASTARRLRHGSLALLRNRRSYVERALYADFSPGSTASLGYDRAAYLNAGRGCARECLCCGGAASSQRITSAREGVLLYPLEKLVGDVREAHAEGARVLRTSFDPPGSRRHVVAWLRRLEAEGYGVRIIYDLWDLPTAGLLDALARSSLPPAVVVYSPECGSERIRRIVRPRSFTNARLLRSIVEAECRGLNVHVFFSAGLPGETLADVDETARLMEEIRRRSGASLSVTPMAVDPASPLWCEPERHGVRLLRRTLRDFYEWRGLPDGPGYETESFGEADIVAAVDRLLGLGRDRDPLTTAR